MSVRGAPTTAAAVGPTDTSLSNTMTAKRNNQLVLPLQRRLQILTQMVTHVLSVCVFIPSELA